MLKVDVPNQKFVELTSFILSEKGFKERHDLQRWIRNSSEAFFNQIQEELLIVGEEIAPSQTVLDKIDLLAVDPDGSAVIIELKRGNNKWQLSQALSYSAMVSKWGQGASFLERLMKNVGRLKNVDKEVMDDFLATNTSELNAEQRIILIAEAYDYEVLVACEWLTEKYHLDIRCYQISLGHDPSNDAMYVSCACVYPPGDLADVAISKGRKVAGLQAAKSWEDWLKGCENDAVKEFFNKEKEAGRRETAIRSALAYPATGTIHWNVEPRRKRAVVVQVGRFKTAQGEQDEKMWRNQLSAADLAPLKNGANLRFFLAERGDFDFFTQTVQSAAELKWFKSSFESDTADTDEVNGAGSLPDTTNLSNV